MKKMAAKEMNIIDFKINRMWEPLQIIAKFMFLFGFLPCGMYIICDYELVGTSIGRYALNLAGNNV